MTVYFWSDVHLLFAERAAAQYYDIHFLGTCGFFVFVFETHQFLCFAFIIKDDFFSLSLHNSHFDTSVDEAEQRDDSVLLNVFTQKKRAKRWHC